MPPHFSTQILDMFYDTIGSNPIEIHSQPNWTFNPIVIKIAVPYRLSVGSWSRICAYTIGTSEHCCSEALSYTLVSINIVEAPIPN